MDGNRLRRYFALVDDGDAQGALALLASDLQFAFVSPSGVTTAGGRPALAAYLDVREPRTHRITSAHSVGATDVAFGASVTADGSVANPFVAFMTFGPDGRALHYHAALLDG